MSSNQPFLNHMFNALGMNEEVKQSVCVGEKKPEPKPKKQESVPVQIMDSDMKDMFFTVGNNDLAEFSNRFISNQYSYSIGGLFGSPVKAVNEEKPFWLDDLKLVAKAGKKSKNAYYIDATDPFTTINELRKNLSIAYPDLIVAL